MAAIEIIRADAVVIGGGDAVEIRRQVCVRVEAGISPAAADVARRQIPACPNRLAQVVAVINRLDGALNQIMIVIVRVGDCAGRVAKLHLQRGVNRRPRR